MFDFLRGIIKHWLTSRVFHIPIADLDGIAKTIGVTPAQLEEAENLIVSAVVSAIVKEI